MNKKIFVFLFLLLAVAVQVFASGGETMPWDTGLDKIKNALGGNTAKTVGLLLIIGAGIALAVTEGQAIKKLFWVVIGIGIALNATSFGLTIFGASSGYLLF
jgi:type IV secretory pathway VirB2 component (pilin)